MTIAKLIAELETLRGIHGGSVEVCCDAKGMLDSINRTWEIVTVAEVNADHVRQVDGDGFGVIDSKGRETHKLCVVLS